MHTVRRHRTLQHNVKAEIVWLVALVVCCIIYIDARRLPALCFILSTVAATLVEGLFRRLMKFLLLECDYFCSIINLRVQ